MVAVMDAMDAMDATDAMDAMQSIQFDWMLCIHTFMSG
jgi:hypothetical protein